MAMFQFLTKSLVHCDENNSWYISVKCHQATGDFFYVLTHEQNESVHEIYMAQYAAEHLQEFLKPENLKERIPKFVFGTFSPTNIR